MNKIDVIKAAAYNIGDIAAVGTSSTATPTSVDVPNFVMPESAQIQGFYLYARNVGTVGWSSQKRILSDFDPANTRCLINAALSFSPSPSGAEITIFRNFPMDEYENAFNQAVGKARLRHLEDYVATIGLNASQYEYAVPSGLVTVVSCRLVPSGPTSDYGGDDMVNRNFNLDGLWLLERNPNGSMCLIFDPRRVDMDNLDDEWIRVIGQVRPSVAPTDVGTVSVEIEQFLIAETTKLMAAKKMTINPDKWKALFGAYRDEANELENLMHRSYRGVTVS